MPLPVANARMYSATPSCRADWKALLGWVLARAGLPWEVIDHDPPAPLAALWARDDLGLAMMCGLPFARHLPPPLLVAAPVPSPARYGGLPRYCSDIVVRADSGHRRIEDTFGGTVGYTVADSLSGGVALRDFLAPYRAAHGGRLYRGAVGGLVHARGVIDALAAGRIDVGALDSYYHDLLRLHAPALAARVRTVTRTAWRPIPPLVATAALGEAALAALRAALAAVGGAAELAPLRERLLLAGFAVPDPSDYAPLAALAGLPTPAFEDL